MTSFNLKHSPPVPETLETFDHTLCDSFIRKVNNEKNYCIKYE